jgi:stage V sporulation protein SpoVS
MSYRRISRLFGSALVLLTLLSAPLGVVSAAPPDQAGAPFVPGELLLKVAPGVSASDMARSVGGAVARSIGDGSILVVKVGAGAVPGAVQALNARSGVVFAEPNWLRQLHDAPNDTGYGLKWDLNNAATLCDGSDCADADADMDWQEAYDLLGANFDGSAIVAVIDTGIDLGAVGAVTERAGVVEIPLQAVVCFVRRIVELAQPVRLGEDHAGSGVERLDRARHGPVADLHHEDAPVTDAARHGTPDRAGHVRGRYTGRHFEQ